MSYESFDNMCMLCLDSEIIYNEDASINSIIENNELIEYKHCMNIRIHPQCLCFWFIQHNNECLICRKTLDISHNTVYDENIFIVTIENNDFSKFDIIYPCKYISIGTRRNNTLYLSPIDTDTDNDTSNNTHPYVSITHTVYGNRNVYDTIETNYMRVIPIFDLCKAIITLIVIFVCIFCTYIIIFSVCILIVL
jgi:hypothetical protein